MTGFAIDDDLRRQCLVALMLLIACADTILQFLHYRTGCINHLNAPLPGNPIGRRGFSVRPKKDAGVRRQGTQIIVINGS